MKTFAYNDWIPRVKHGAGLLEFTPAKAGAGMTTKLKDPAGGWLHFLHKDSKERQTPLEIPVVATRNRAGHYF